MIMTSQTIRHKPFLVRVLEKLVPLSAILLAASERPPSFPLLALLLVLRGRRPLPVSAAPKLVECRLTSALPLRLKRHR